MWLAVTEEMKKQQKLVSSSDLHEFKSHSMSGNSEATEVKGNKIQKINQPIPILKLLLFPCSICLFQIVALVNKNQALVPKLPQVAFVGVKYDSQPDVINNRDDANRKKEKSQSKKQRKPLRPGKQAVSLCFSDWYSFSFTIYSCLIRSAWWIHLLTFAIRLDYLYSLLMSIQRKKRSRTRTLAMSCSDANE